MRKTFRYRLYPTKRQVRVLEGQLEECRWLYNHFLEERRTAYEQTGQGIRLFDQQKELPNLKAKRPSLAGVHSQVLQNVTIRLDLAFQAFFRRVGSGEKPGYPRFRGQGRYDSMTFPQAPSGCELRDGFLRLSKVGAVKIVLHRPMEGQVKTCTIKRSSTGKWYACFSCEVQQPEPLPQSKEQVGIDVGLYSFATFSTGETVENPRLFRKEEKELAKAQRRLSEEETGTKERGWRRKVVSRIHERIAFRRNNFAHQEARKIVNRFGFIAVEDLEVNRMVHNHCLAKSIADAAWSLFFMLLFVKAVYAGRTVVKVNPAFTSQDCSACGHRQKMPLTERVFRCPCCKLEIDRDHNASLNILGLGLQAVG
jgi:putative transposase